MGISQSFSLQIGKAANCGNILLISTVVTSILQKTEKNSFWDYFVGRLWGAKSGTDFFLLDLFYSTTFLLNFFRTGFISPNASLISDYVVRIVAIVSIVCTSELLSRDSPTISSHLGRRQSHPGFANSVTIREYFPWLLDINNSTTHHGTGLLISDIYKTWTSFLFSFRNWIVV